MCSICKMGDEETLDVHRVRFVNRAPFSIHCLSFLDGGNKLALSRGDGSIEIWDYLKCVFNKKLWIPGRANTSIEDLQWCQERLFSGSLNGLLEEWDFATLQPCRLADPCGGPIWCIRVNTRRSHIAIGCENGQVHLFDVTNNNLVSMRCLDQLNVRIISLAWHSSDSYLAVGSTDGIIRKFNTESGACVLEIAHDSSMKSVIWDLKYLDAFLVSADSQGRVQIWNSVHGTVFQTFKEHRADVLALAIDHDHSIYSSGVDKKIVRIKKLADKNEWVKDGDVKIHTHDVRALDISSDGILASGGMDTRLVITQTKIFKAHKSVEYCQFRDSSHFFSIAYRANVIMHQSNLSVHLWKLSFINESTQSMPINFLNITNKGIHYILSSSISSGATKVAVSTVDHLWLYNLNMQEAKVNCIHFSKCPSYKMEFCCDDTLLVLATINEGIILLNVDSLNRRKLKNDFCLPPITDFCCNRNNSFILTKNMQGDNFLYDLKGETVVYKVPKMNEYPMHFFCHSNDFIIYSCPDIYFFNVSSCQFSKLGQIKVGNKLIYPKDFCYVNDNVFAVYDDKSLLLIKACFDQPVHSVKCQPLEIDGLCLFVSSFVNGEVIIVEQLWHNGLPKVLSTSQYGT